MLSRAQLALAGRRASPAASTFDTTLFIEKPAGATGGLCLIGDALNQATWRVILASAAVTVRKAVSCHRVSPSSKSPLVGLVAIKLSMADAPATVVGFVRAIFHAASSA